MVSFVFFLGSLGCFAAASIKTQTKSSGHLFWKDETTVAVPTETRLAWLGGGVVLMIVAVALALLLYRISVGREGIGGSAPHSVTSSDTGGLPYVRAGHSKEFWIQTTIAMLGLVIAAVSAAAAWWT